MTKSSDYWKQKGKRFEEIMEKGSKNPLKDAKIKVAIKSFQRWAQKTSNLKNHK